MATAKLWAPVNGPYEYLSGTHITERGGFKSDAVTCTWDANLFAPGEVAKELHKLLDPVVLPTRSMLVDYDTSPLANNLRREYNVVPTYYGGMVQTTEVVPGPTLVADETWRVKAKGSMKQWKQAKVDGTIVFKPLNTGKFAIASQPGLDVKYRIGGVTRVGYNRQWDKEFLPLGTGLCTTSVRRMQMPDERVRGSLQAFGRIQLDMQSFSDVRWLHLEDLFPGLHDALKEFGHSIDANRIYDQGLTTSVICEANAGAWDIATEIAEGLRETVPSIVNACAHIIRKYLEVRKKIKVLRKNSISESRNLAELKADIASLWLNFRYGIGPLAYTIQDSLAYFDSSFKKYSTYRDGMTKELEFVHGELVGTVKVTHRCVVRDFFDASLLGRYNTSGLKINFFDTWWQLQPTSFMIDWVLNIGDVMSSLVEPDGLKVRKLMYSVRCKDSMVLTHPSLPGGSVTIDLDVYSATPSVREPVGLQFNPQMSSKRWMDAIAIFWGGVKKPLQYR